MNLRPPRPERGAAIRKGAARIACSCLTGEDLLTGTGGRRMYQPPPRLMHQSTCHVTCYRKESVAGGFKPPQCDLRWSALRSLGLNDFSWWAL